jgi:hypothetical protein
MSQTGCCPQNVSADVPEGVAEVSASDPENAPAPEDDPRRACVSCGGSSRPVTRKTMMLMLRAEHFDAVADGEYRFCADPECRVVYFTEGKGASFTTDDLRVRVGLKEKTDPIPLCYCFGFDEADARGEISSTGRSTISQRIAALIKQGMCACPERNPSGACCLGEVNRAVKRLLAEAANVRQTA